MTNHITSYERKILRSICCLRSTDIFCPSRFVWKFKGSKVCLLENGMLIWCLYDEALWRLTHHMAIINHYSVLNSHLTAITNMASWYHKVSYFLYIHVWYFHIFTFLLCSVRTVFPPWLESLIDWLDLHVANFGTWDIYRFWAHVLISYRLVKLFFGA